MFGMEANIFKAKLATVAIRMSFRVRDCHRSLPINGMNKVSSTCD